MSFSDSITVEPCDRDSITIDCDTCIMKDTDACDDCLVTYLCDRPAEQAVVVNLADFRAMKALANAGLVPDLRHEQHST